MSGCHGQHRPWYVSHLAGRYIKDHLPWSFCDETAGCQLLRLDEGCLSVPRKKTTAEDLELIIMLVDHLALYTAIDSAVSRHVDLHDLVHCE